MKNKNDSVVWGVRCPSSLKKKLIKKAKSKNMTLNKLVVNCLMDVVNVMD